MLGGFPSFSQSKKEKVFGILDIGSGSVKFLIIKKQGPKTIILAKALQDYDRFSVFESREFELDVVKKAIGEALKQAMVRLDVQIRGLIIGLPPHVFKAKTAHQIFGRAHPKKIINKEEAKTILNAIWEGSKKRVGEHFARESGILPQELRFLLTEPLEIKINGYPVPEIAGFKGKTLEFVTLTTFLPEYYLKKIENLIKGLGFRIVKIAHEVEGLGRALPRDHNRLFLDIGADFTQMFLMARGNLEMISEFKSGGKDFFQSLRQSLGLSYSMAKDLVEKYQRGTLGEETRARLKEIFWQEAQHWHSNLEKKLEGRIFFEEIVCFGGASYYPEIEEVLEKNYELAVKILKPKNLLNIEDQTSNKKDLQFIPAILLSYVI